MSKYLLGKPVRFYQNVYVLFILFFGDQHVLITLCYIYRFVKMAHCSTARTRHETIYVSCSKHIHNSATITR